MNRPAPFYSAPSIHLLHVHFSSHFVSVSCQCRVCVVSVSCLWAQRTHDVRLIHPPGLLFIFKSKQSIIKIEFDQQMFTDGYKYICLRRSYSCSLCLCLCNKRGLIRVPDVQMSGRGRIQMCLCEMLMCPGWIRYLLCNISPPRTQRGHIQLHRLHGQPPF